MTGSSTGIGQGVCLELAQQVASSFRPACNTPLLGDLPLCVPLCVRHVGLLKGWQVFSGVRSQADAEALRQLHNGITPVIIDVTS